MSSAVFLVSSSNSSRQQAWSKVRLRIDLRTYGFYRIGYEIYESFGLAYPVKKNHRYATAPLSSSSVFLQRIAPSLFGYRVAMLSRLRPAPTLPPHRRSSTTGRVSRSRRRSRFLRFLQSQRQQELRSRFLQSQHEQELRSDR